MQDGGKAPHLTCIPRHLEARVRVDVSERVLELARFHVSKTLLVEVVTRGRNKLRL